jgi:hypothetical protein
MKKILGTTIIVILVAALTTGVVVAEEEPPTVPGSRAQTRDRSNNRVLVEYMNQAIADLLGISLEEYDSFKLAGMTLVEMAEELGIDEETLLTLHADAREIALAAAEADGVIVKVQQRARLRDGNGRGNGQWNGYGGNGAGQCGGGMFGDGSCDGSGYGYCTETTEPTD